jgi:AraC-like DNA-binding protein
VLVIGLESGFASVGPFTRAFKQFTGLTPNQYRQQFGLNKAQVA